MESASSCPRCRGVRGTSRAWSRSSASTRCCSPTARTWRRRCGASSSWPPTRPRKLKLGPGVSNSVTRDAAVTASAALTLQVESEGRAVLGMGRGDSSVQRIGKREDKVASFAAYLEQVQRYLRGEAVDRDGFASRLEWLPHVEGAQGAAYRRRHRAARDRGRRATWPTPSVSPPAPTRRTSARCSSTRATPRAQPAATRTRALRRLRQLRDQRRPRSRARRVARHGRDLRALLGVPRQQAGTLPGPLQGAAAQYLRAHYDMREHTRADAAHTAGISDEFVDWFAIAGPPTSRCRASAQLAALGLDFCYVVPARPTSRATSPPRLSRPRRHPPRVASISAPDRRPWDRGRPARSERQGRPRITRMTRIGEASALRSVSSV